MIDDYIIERVIAEGGFSTVYLARQLADQQQVAIKEYKPKHLTLRSGSTVTPIDPASAVLFQRGRRLFLEEATLLSSLKHPNIVSVLNFFLTNETAYLVMNFDYGTTLGHKLKKTNQHIDADFLLSTFKPILSCIKNMHQRGVLHLDIKPDNILIRPSTTPLILDFGSALLYKKNYQPQAHSMTKGYASPEQHSNAHPLGPWSDMYAIGASMRTCLDRSVPPAACDEAALSKLPSCHHLYKKSMTPKLLQAIDWAMQADPVKRPQTVDDFLNAINYL